MSDVDITEPRFYSLGGPWGEDWAHDQADKVILKIDAHPNYKITILNQDRRVNGQAVYTKLRQLWKDSPDNFWRDNFPMVANSPVHFEMVPPWKIVNPLMLSFDAAWFRKGLQYND